MVDAMTVSSEFAVVAAVTAITAALTTASALLLSSHTGSRKYILGYFGWALRLVRFLCQPKLQTPPARDPSNCQGICHCKTTAFWHLVGNTPLVKLQSLSSDLGLTVLGKAEFCNPGGSIKDRVACALVREGEATGALARPGDIIVEGTSGSSGISLTLAGLSRGYHTLIFIPGGHAAEKIATIESLGATVVKTPLRAITDPEHYCNVAQRTAEQLMREHAANSEKPRAYFTNQFENLANYRSHYFGTGEEIWRQTKGTVTAFVTSSGSGGSIAGVGNRLKDYNNAVKVILADPPGSALSSRVNNGVLYNKKDAEGHRQRIVDDTVVEGVGSNRLTRNFELARIDHAFSVSDSESVRMAHYLLENEGLFVGSSTALNCCGLVKAVKAGILGPADTVVVLLCDSGTRHLSRFYNLPYLKSRGILTDLDVKSADCGGQLEQQTHIQTNSPVTFGSQDLELALKSVGQTAFLKTERRRKLRAFDILDVAT